MNHVVSKDGTPIAFERMGSGPAVILVGGGADDGSENAPLVPALAEHFTAINYARRGRGESGNTLPYALEREFEDIEALIEMAGGEAHLYGVSTGGSLTLEAVAAGPAEGLLVNKVGVYEVPYPAGFPEGWQAYVVQLNQALAEGRRGDAFALFMGIAGSSEEEIAQARASEYWPGCEALAHTLAYDAATLGDGIPPAGRLARITQPVLVATGGGNPFFEDSAAAVMECLPHAERIVIEGQGHVADPKAVTDMLVRFFNS